MKIEKLFKKIEKYFSLDEEEREKKSKKKAKLTLNLEEKIEDMKLTIKECKDEEQKNAYKKELEVLQGLREKLQ